MPRRRKPDSDHRSHDHGNQAVQRIEEWMREHDKEEDRRFAEAIEAWAQRGRASATERGPVRDLREAGS
jgi:hypothetical protein